MTPAAWTRYLIHVARRAAAGQPVRPMPLMIEGRG